MPAKPAARCCFVADGIVAEPVFAAQPRGMLVSQADKVGNLPVMVTEYNVHSNYEWDMRASTVDTPWEVRQLLLQSAVYLCSAYSVLT